MSAQYNPRAPNATDSRPQVNVPRHGEGAGQHNADPGAPPMGREGRKRLTVSRSDLIGLLSDKHARTVKRTYPHAYRGVVEVVKALVGTLTRLLALPVL